MNEEKTRGIPWLFGMLLLGALIGYYGAQAQVKKTPVQKNQQIITDGVITQKQVDFRNTMRKLLSDHVVWSKTFVTSAVSGLPDADKALDRLKSNKNDIANALQPFYSTQDKNRIGELLDEHIKLEGEIVEALKAKDNGRLNELKNKAQNNSEQIATVLTAANQKISKQDLLNSLNRHSDLFIDWAGARVNKDYDKEIASANKAFEHSAELADMLSMGVIKQFPNQF